VKRIRRLITVLLLSACLGAQAGGSLPPPLFDFEFESWSAAGWKTSGTAFGTGPAEGAIKRQMPVAGFNGRRLVNSFFDGSDRPTGTLTSPPFTIQRRYLNFLIGGGGWDGRTCVNLVVDGKIVRTATGPNTRPGGSETLQPATWDVSAFVGRVATLQVVDHESGGWGHITLDDVVQSDQAAAAPIAEPPSPEVLAAASFDAIMERIRNFEIVAVDPASPHYARVAAEVRKMIGREDLTLADKLRATREMREQLWADPFRPTYHLTPPDGFWNDINGTLYWKGRYHVFFLGRRAPELDVILSGKDTARSREVWLHASSKDLVHWIWHPTALNFPQDGTMLRGVFSGGAVAGAEKPTLIYHVPGQGTCIATSDDDLLINWTPHPENPVIPQRFPNPEVVVFDPAAWKEGDTYYALIGNKNRRPGYEGDTPSLFKSKDLVRWEYLHPLYKSDRKWTHVDEDAACPDFFPIGNGKHMLVTHVHAPMYSTQYYIGTWRNEVFHPEQHGRMSWPGGQMSGPETLLDGQGRRIFFGWVRDAKPMRDGWGSLASLPRVLSLDANNQLLIQPPPELEVLRDNPRSHPATRLVPGAEVPLAGFRGNTVELALEIDPGQAGLITLDLLRSEDGRERTTLIYSPKDGTLSFDLARSSLDPSVRYEAFDRGYAARKNIPAEQRLTTRQVAPFKLAAGETLKLRVFIDRSIIEVFANDRQCLTQRVYPTLPDSRGVVLRSEGSGASLVSATAWDIAPTNSW